MNRANRSSNRFLVLYFLIAFGFTWLLWLPSVIITLTNNESAMYWIYDIDMSLGLGILALGGIFATFGPLVAAFVVTRLEEGKEGIRHLWQRFWNVRLAGIWLLISFVLPIILILVPRLVVIPLGYPLDLGWVSPVMVVGWLLNNFTRSGGISEEFGWRGYVLPKLQKKWNALVSSIILGMVWAVWHLPLWLLAGSSQQGSSFLLFSVNLVLLSFLYTWLVNNAKGSVLVAVVFHAMSNTVAQIIPASTDNLFYWIFLVVVVLLVIIIYGPKKLTRKIKRDEVGTSSK